jgi:pimeloyl-ACP methyl ester carboxylesterase
VIEADDAAATPAALPADSTAVDWAPYLHDLIVDGRRIRYLSYGEGKPLLLIHGIGCSWEYWSLNIASLAHGHRVIAVDLPGFGSSEPLPAGADLADSADAVLKLLDQLEIEQAVVVGHSLGGLVAWLLAARHPQRVSALVLVCAATVALSPRQVNAIVRSFTVMGRLLGIPGVGRAVVRRPRLRWLVLRGLVRRPATLDPALAAKLVAAQVAPPGFTEALRAGPEALAHVDAVALTQPALLIWGEKDPFFPLVAARKLAAAMPDAELIEFPRVGHCPQLEQPAEFNAALLQFLNRPR